MRALDTLLMSTGAIVANKLRSMLTLVGIVAGVASIIAVMTAISVIQGTMEREMSVLGTQTFQVQKWPAGGFTSPAQRRKAMRRPPLTLENAAAIRAHVKDADLVGFGLRLFVFGDVDALAIGRNGDQDFAERDRWRRREFGAMRLVVSAGLVLGHADVEGIRKLLLEPQGRD